MNFLISMPDSLQLMLMFGGLALTIVPLVFYLLTLQSTFNTVSPENRKMPSSNVWLLLIPVFGLVWHFFVVNRLSDSIQAEANARNIKLEESRPTRQIGLAMCILAASTLIPVINALTGLAFIVCWIIYWVKINNYRKILLETEANLLARG